MASIPIPLNCGSSMPLSANYLDLSRKTQWHDHCKGLGRLTGGRLDAMSQHVTLSSIADHILDTKPLDTPSLQHLDACTECQCDYEWLKVLRNLGRSDSARDAA